MVRDRRVKRRRMGERGRINGEWGKERKRGRRKERERDSYVDGGRGETAILPMVDAEGSIVGKLGNLKRWQSYSSQRDPRHKDAACVMRTATLASRETRSAKRSFSIVPRYSIRDPTYVRISRSIFPIYTFETNQQVCSLPARLEKKQVASLSRIIGISKFGVVRKFEYKGGEWTRR